jgi:hypothetical protein
MNLRLFENLKRKKKTSVWIGAALGIFWFLVWVLGELLKDRIFGWANSQIDEKAAAMLNMLAIFIHWVTTNPVLFFVLVAVTFCLVVILIALFSSQETIRILRPTEESIVGWKDGVRGTATPINLPIQVLLHSRNGKWYLQRDAEWNDSEWSTVCQFGDERVPRNSRYSFIAVSGKRIKPEDSPLEDLPSGLIRSKIVNVQRG